MTEKAQLWSQPCTGPMAQAAAATMRMLPGCHRASGPAKLSMGPSAGLGRPGSREQRSNLSLHPKRQLWLF